MYMIYELFIYTKVIKNDKHFMDVVSWRSETIVEKNNGECLERERKT